MESKKDEFLYVLITDIYTDNVIFDNPKDASIASFKNSCFKVLIFKKYKDGSFKPTQRYYLGGKLI